MNKLIILPLLSAFLVSCADKKKDEEDAEPVSQPKVAAAPTTAPVPAQDANPTAVFRIPKKDTNLPTSEQLADGADSSIGKGNKKATAPSNQPSAAIKPPSPVPTPKPPVSNAPADGDDLAPSE